MFQRINRNLGLVGVVLLFAGIGTYLILSSHAAPPSTKHWHNDNFTTALQSNGQIEAISQAYHQNHGRAQAATKALSAYADQRKTILLDLMQTNPQEAANLLLPDNVSNDINSFANGSVEKKVNISGTFIFIHQDIPNGEDRTIFSVQTDNGTYDLYSNGQIPTMKAGTKVTLTGYLLGNSIFLPTVTHNDQPAIYAFSGGSGSPGTLGGVTPLGPVNAAVIVANFSNSPTPLNMTNIQNAFNGNAGKDVDSYYAEASYNKSTLNPSFFTLTLPETLDSQQNCPKLANQLSSEVLAAESSTITYANYQRFIFMFNCKGSLAVNQGQGGEAQLCVPQNTGVVNSVCPSPNGLVTSSVMWLFGSATTDAPTIAHELGHNLGNAHASIYVCEPYSFIPPTRFDQGCITQEYGDITDVLGSGNVGGNVYHYNALHKSNAGWFTAANYPTLSTPGSYTYKIMPFESVSTGVMSLKIPRGNTGTYFTVEYRQPIGFDSTLGANCSSCTYNKGVAIKLADTYPGTGGGGDTQNIDTTPNSLQSGSYYNSNDHADAALLPGKTFSDAETGITVNTVSADSTGATVTVNVPAAASCTRQQPTITLLTPSSQTATTYGQTEQYTYSIKSNDSSSCSSEKYKFITPTGFGNNVDYTTNRNMNFTINNDSFTLAPGATTTVTASWFPQDGSMIDATYSTVATLYSDSIAVKSIPTPAISYILKTNSTSDTTPPSTPSGVTSIVGSGNVQIKWNPSTDNTRVAYYQINRNNGSVWTTANTSLLDYGLSPNTTYTYTVTAFDGHDNPSQPVSITVTTPILSDFSAPTATNSVTSTATDHSVTLNWLPSTDNMGVFYYYVSYSDALVGGTTRIVVPASQSSITINSLESNNSYYFTIQAVDSAGNASTAGASNYNVFGADVFNVGSPLIIVNTALTGTTIPTTPTNLYSPSGTTTGGINLTWSASTSPTGIAGYHVYRNGLQWATVTTNSYNDPATDLNPTNNNTGSGQYYYYVEAFDSAGNISAPSEEGYVTSPHTLSTSDSTAPTGSITTPTNSSNVTGTVTFQASASDNVGVTNVTYWLMNGYNNIGCQLYTSPYTCSWDTTKYSNGPVTIYAEIYDASNNYITTTPINLTINNGGNSDTIPPTVSITSPTNNSSVSGTVSVNANASDNVSLANVVFQIDGNVVATDTASPYVYSWDTTKISNGTHNITAIATDSSGLTATSNVQVNVSNADTTPPSVPTGLTATSTAFNNVNLSWSPSTDNTGVAGYYVVRNGVTIANVTSGTNYSDSSVSGSTAYTYQVLAYDAAGNNSTLSTSANATTPPTPDTSPPSQPINLVANVISSSQINLSWTASTDNVGVTGYNVFRNGVKVASVGTNSFGDTGLSANTIYQYYVIAYDSAGNMSQASSTVSAKTLSIQSFATLQGTVNASNTSKGLAGATVSISVNQATQNYTTSSTGTYLISNLIAGTYNTKYSNGGYKTQSFSLTLNSGQTLINNVTLSKNGNK
ncbi:MAG TPA: Ig-like domain-containing protein [Candidatus Saccharimonadales bacterium]|nr:Ig-like domain-containing protein [Candidatus Saccharimonadales bacterium]